MSDPGLDEAREWAERRAAGNELAGLPDDGVVLAGDLRLLEQQVQGTVEHLLNRFEELHTRLWELEERVKRLTERMDEAGDSPRH